MGVECVKTCVIHASEMMANYEKARVIALLRESIDFERLSAIQFCPRGLIRITFKNASDKEDFARMGSLALDGHDLSVTSSDKPPSLVYVHYFPAEGNDALICDELSKYGEIVNIKHQSFSGIPGLLTGSRILTMVLSDPVPAEFRIDDYPVRVWYRGIPPFCQICKVNGHKAADCQFNGKCRRCGSPDHKARACVRPWGQLAAPMEVALPEVVPDPSETVVSEVAVPVVVPDPPEIVVPAVSDSSAILDETVVEDEVAVAGATEDEAAVKDDEVTVGDVPVAEEVQASSASVSVLPVAVPGPCGSPVGSSPAVSTVPALSRVASSSTFTPEARREFLLGYRDFLCQSSGDAAVVFSYKNSKVCRVFPADDLEEVRITFESGESLIVHANLVRIAKADASKNVSEEEFTQIILKVKDDPSYRISFRGSIVDLVGPTEHSNVLWVGFTDHTGPQSRRLPAWALSVVVFGSSDADVYISNVNKSSSTVGDDIINVSRNSSRSVVPTAAVLAAELLKRTTPPSVLGVPKCRKKL